MASKGETVKITKKGNLYQGQEGKVLKVDGTQSYPVVVKLPNGDIRHYSHDEVESK